MGGVTPRVAYDQMIRDELGPSLRARGFRKRRNNFRRTEEAGWQVVDFQASQWGSRDEVRFTLNLWVGVTELADADADSHVQERIGAVLDGDDRWWSVDATTDIDRLADELRRIVDEYALPWLQERSSLDRLLALARSSPDEFPRYALERFAMLLAKSDRHDLASEISALVFEN